MSPKPALKIVEGSDENRHQSRIVPGLDPVDFNSSDEEILAAIDFAGDYIATVQPEAREWDWRECETEGFIYRIYRFAFVQPYDISDDPRMTQRLTHMIHQGTLSGNHATGTHVRVSRKLGSPEEEYRPRN
ncbi:MAG: hypothetical protein KIH67_002380 [Candidatus Moranbacteria bacterium]|nr:hypothetical protein [Candidatus Moranbacteria bacterium]